MSEVEIINTPLGGASLTGLAITGQGAAASWYAQRPADPSAWRARAARLQDEARGPVSASADWLSALEPAIRADGAAADRLARSADGRGLVVTTGQQPGLFGGPIYTLSKALSALAFANVLEEAAGIPVCPVFWAATDDADFAEASTTYVAIRGGVEAIALPTPEREGASLRDVPLGDVRGLLRRLSAAAGSAPNERVWSLVEQAYSGDATIGTSYVKLLRALLHPLGIPVLDAGHPAFRERTHPILRRALEHAGEIDRALRERIDEIERAGLRPQVDLVPGLSTVFETSPRGAGARQRVPIDRAAKVAAQAAAGSLGANVLLRPVLERTVLPTLGYVAGPGELAYFAEVGALAEALGLPVPLALPRWSCRILEPHVRRILERYELSPEQLRDPHAAETRLTNARIPDELQHALQDWRAQDRRSAQAMAQAIARSSGGAIIDPRVVEGASAAIEHRLDRLERRVRAAVKRHEIHLLEDLATARASLFPLGKPQERVLNALPFLARHGDDLIQKMLANATGHATSLVSGGQGALSAATLAGDDPLRAFTATGE